MECPKCGTKTDSWPCPNCGFPVTRVITPERFRKKKTMAIDSVRYHSSFGK